MMDPKEFRIGNLAKSLGEFIRITNLENGVLKEVVPIKITRDLFIKKCGAVKQQADRYNDTFFIGKLRFTYERNEMSEFIRFHYSGKVVYLQYLHQLQNLYFVLTGEELVINL